MKRRTRPVLGVQAPAPRLTWGALTLLACTIAAPVAVILWGIEAAVR